MAGPDYSIFEHDDAADWLGSFESDGLSSVKAALDLVAEADAGSYIEIADAAPAMAAAEIVAAARDDDASRLPKAVKAAFKEHRGDVEDADLVSEALKAVRRILKNSELKDQWDEAGDSEEWGDHVSELLERLKG
jgi:antitoxin (DNA-binding transcriptional repressor) of toxin-antitoxin stability system